MENNLKINVSANLDKAKSIAQINKDIKNIEKQLAKLKLKATIDKSELQKQIKALNQQRHELYVSLKVRKNELKAQYKKAVEEAQAQPLNVNVNTANAKKQVTELTNTVQTTRSETVTLASALKKSFSNMGLVVSAQTCLQLVRQAANEAKQAIMEYDKYATNLKIITNKDNVSDMVADYADKSIKMGVNVSEYLDAAQNILRAGKSVEESNQFIEKSLMLAKTGFIDAESAANNLLVISNSYDVSAEKLENLTDTLLFLDGVTQTTAGSLSEAMAKSAKTAQLSGLSYEKLAAMIAQLKNSTGKSESELSTSINQILNRTYRVKPNAYIFENENGETEDMTKPLSDVEKIMNQLNISIRKSKTEFKDFEDIISTIAPVWKDLSTVDQNAIASVFGG